MALDTGIHAGMTGRPWATGCPASIFYPSALAIEAPKPIQYCYKCIKNKTKDILL